MQTESHTIIVQDDADAYYELHNSYPRTIRINHMYWLSVEHYYQAQKFQQSADQQLIYRAKTPEAARELGRTSTAERVPSWETHKAEVMQDALYEKFKQNEDLKQLLIETGTALIHYVSTTEQYWGITSEGVGQNALGTLLMAVRTKLQTFEQMRVQASQQTPWMSIQKDVLVPTVYGDLRFNVYMDNKGKEHIAILFGTIHPGRPVLTRIHSECLTGDLFKSLKCDCGEQLESALQAMQQAAEQGSGGVLLYMRDEGRGIGLGNKLRAYKFQEQGLDTREANEVLDLPVDARSYHLPARILQELGITQVQLMTNNPDKIRGLTMEGIQVVRETIQSPENPHNVDYIATKNNSMGHSINIE